MQNVVTQHVDAHASPSGSITSTKSNDVELEAAVAPRDEMMEYAGGVQPVHDLVVGLAGGLSLGGPVGDERKERPDPLDQDGGRDHVELLGAEARSIVGRVHVDHGIAHHSIVSCSRYQRIPGRPPIRPDQ